MSADRLVRQMRRLLDEERTAFLSGDFDRLGTLLKRKGAVIESLERHPPTAAQLVDLGERLRRNQSLATAAQDGIRAVGARLEGLARGVPSGTYGANGTRTDIAAPRRTLAKRA